MTIKEFDIEYKKKFLKYTKKAFSLLPVMDYPKILDIGCGTGEATIELAKLSNSNIIGIDINQQALEKLNKRRNKNCKKC
ncbi:MAG: class I SAM-dependent methyltransferase [Candidatus Lokiarchaeota archaeon]|nr:class I SAM-dependent methyltransferase [Candidatus Lokiarchaeota archaeon]